MALIGDLRNEFTLNRYLQTLKDVFDDDGINNIIITSCIVGFVFTYININIAMEMTSLFKIVWLIPAPYLILYSMSKIYISNKDLLIDVNKIMNSKGFLTCNRVIYTILTKGDNIKTTKRTARSVIYWCEMIKRKYGIDFRYEVWVVTEEDAYRDEDYNELKTLGIRVLIVPRRYTTKNQTIFKARALNYAKEVRRLLNLNTKDVWIYHQDEETIVGEDTILGNLEFIIDARRYNYVFGTGIILYNNNWHNKPTFVNEIVRSSNDLLLLYFIKQKLKGFGFHGSHFICRSDIEDRIGWDFGMTKAEDCVFVYHINKYYKKNVGIMHGFAYESAPFTIHDHLKQRRRWIRGIFATICRNDVDKVTKLVLLYSIISWYSSLLAIIVTIFNIIYPTADLYIGMAFLTGMIWYCIYDSYRTGYRLHKHYINNNGINLVYNMILGLLLESIAPWYALIKNSNTFECIKKDYDLR